MREYEVMHIQGPTPTPNYNHSTHYGNNSGTGISIRPNPQANVQVQPIEFELSSPDSPTPVNHTFSPITTVVIVREPQPKWWIRVLNSLTITEVLQRSFNSRGGGPGTNARRSRNGSIISENYLIEDEDIIFQHRNFNTSENTVSPANTRQSPDMKHKQRWILLVFVLISLALILILSNFKLTSNITRLTSHQLGITVDLEELTERSKCPACFGVNLCPDILLGNIELNDWNKFSMSRLVNVKNVFYATWKVGGSSDSERQVVLKKLAHNNELDELDRSICNRHHGEGVNERCEVSDAVTGLIDEYKIEQSEPGKPVLLHNERIGTGSDFLLCPSHRKMDYFVGAANSFLRGAHHSTILANVLTMILLNPEPLYLQAFSPKNGWTMFPKYYGSCGRIIVEEYVGLRLTTFYQEKFYVRAELSLQLLHIANFFYENPSNLILYLTDLSPDNFAVDENTMTLKIIDLGDLIVVDKQALIQSKAPNADKLLVSESQPCGADGNKDNLCFSFMPNDLCERPLTDHNYYAVCAALLAPNALDDEIPNGLLHSLPSEFTTDPNLSRFSQTLEKCKDPKLGSKDLKLNRIQAAQELKNMLEFYLKMYGE